MRSRRTRVVNLGEEPDCSIETSNGEVEGPRACARLEPRVRTLFPHRGDTTDSHRPLQRLLRGRPEAPDQAPRADNVFSARGADTQAAHGPLQRLLGVLT